MNNINYRLIIIIIFTILYLPHCFIMVNDISLITAYEVDPGSIIDSIEKLYSGKIYNMLNGYHSKFYGWTYMSINFWLLLPIKVFNLIFGITNKTLFYLTLKFIYFLIGLILTLLVYKLSIKINKNNSDKAAFVAGLLLLLLPTSSQFYFVHPETTGALFLLLAIQLISVYGSGGNKKYYIFGIVCLSLASLSKQIFFFTAIPVFIVYYYLGVKKFKLRPVALFFLTLGLGAVTLLLIHPYAYIYPKLFIGYQIDLSTSLSGGNQINYFSSLRNWILFIYSNASILILPIISMPFLFINSIYQYKKSNSIEYLLLIVVCACGMTSLFFVAYGNRISHSHHYLFQFYIFLILIMSFLIDAVTKLKNKKASIIITVLVFYVMVATCLHYAYYTIPNSISRLNFEKSVATVSYNYINQKLKRGDKLVMDYQVAIPTGTGVIGCGMWTGCGTEADIGSFKPDYIMFDQQAAGDISPSEFAAFKDFVRKNNYKLIDKLSVQGDYNIFTGRRMVGSEILVYKR